MSITVTITISELDLIANQQRTIMAKIDDLKAAQAAEKADLAVLAGLVTQLLTAFAAGSITPNQAQALLDEMNGQDTTVKANIASIQAALGATSPAP